MSDALRVLHISTSDIDGGAALAAYRLHRAMRRRPHCSSTMLVRTRESQDPSVVQARVSMNVLQRVKRAVRRSWIDRDCERYSQALSKVEIFSDDRGWAAGNVTANVSAFDIIQLHWISQFLDYRRFFKAVPDVPLVWRLADMNPFTGGCHYDGDCGRFANACGCCPMLESRQENDLSRDIWERKSTAFNQISTEGLHVVALTQWMARHVRRSSLLGRFECTVIPNGVDLEEFKPVAPAAAREALDIPNGRQVVAFVSHSVGNVRKGFNLLLKALDRLSTRRNLFLLIVGASDNLPPLSLPCLQVGSVQSVPFLRQIYSAADLFVIPSLEDNQPNTVLEAMACGTPVVGFKAGGIPEMVEEGVTGLLASPGNVPELAAAIEFLLDHEPERLRMAIAARRRIEEVFTRDAQVQEYLNLYSRLLSRRKITTITRRPVPDSSLVALTTDNATEELVIPNKHT